MSELDRAEEAAVRELVARYTDAVNRGDADDWAATWTPDAEWNLAGQAIVGRDEIVSRWRTLMSGFSWLIQLVYTGTVSVDGERATARWYLSELSVGQDGSRGLIVGVYHDECRRSDGTWRFSKRRFDMLYAGPPDLSGHTLPFPKL